MEVIGAFGQIAASRQAAKANRAAGQADSEALKAKAEEAESKAKDEELLRLQNLRLTMATQRAYWAAAGLDASTGSPTTIANRSLETFKLDQGAALINTRAQIRSFNNQANNAIKIGNIRAKGSIMSGYAGAANTIASSQ
tara:strand:- start:502 stop:921 length:420 start_codon:yes stop_codon:yes gene_type:complete